MRLVSIIFTLLISMACMPTKGGEKGINDNNQTLSMKTFDIKKFDQNKGEDETYTFEREDGALVVQFGDSESGYFEYTRGSTQLFEDRKGYYPNGMIKVHGAMYYNQFQKGVWKYYDQNGQVQRTTDFDAPFDYGWEEVLVFCEDKKINLWSNTTRISRNTDDGIPKWIIEWQVGTAESLEITIDGRSGEILDENTIILDKG